MIKIEITDIEKLDAATLHATGCYLIQLGESHVHRHPSEELPVAQDGEPVALCQYEVEDNTPEIEESFIPVAPETVEIPITAQVFIPPVPELTSVSAAQVFAAPAPTSSVELDSKGMPWDSRIHARTKTKMKDGSWKLLRGVGPEVVNRVETELKAVQNIPAPPVYVTGLPVPPALGFSDLMSVVTKAITEGKLKRDQVNDILESYGVPSLPLVATRTDLIPNIIGALNEVINAQ